MNFYFTIGLALLLAAGPLGAVPSLADALGTPEMAWEGIDGGEGSPFAALDPEANGGAKVVLPNRSSLETDLTDEGIIRIRFKGYQPTVTLGAERLTVEILARSPEEAESEYQAGVVLIPPGGGLLEIATHWQLEVDMVASIRPPPSIAATLGLPDIVTNGGAGNWSPTAAHRLGKYVAALWVDEAIAEGWFEFPVTGPAEVNVAYDGANSWPAIEFFLDGRRAWDSGAEPYASARVSIEIPAGEHLLRCSGRNARSYGMHLRITSLAINPLAAEGKLGAAMDHTAAWASWGDWESSAALSYDGVDALRPLPPADPPYASFKSEHLVQTPVSGPGYVSFMSHMLDTPEADYSALLQWSSGVHRNAYRRFSDTPQGWMKHTVWFPPGEHWIRWGISGTAQELSLVAFDELTFEASEVIDFDELVGDVGGIWENDPERPWSGVRKEAGGEGCIISPVLGQTESSTLSLTVEGPGDLHFHWSNGAKGSTEGELWINGVKSSRELPPQAGGETVHLAVPQHGSVTLEWRFEARFDGNWAEMKNIEWIPWPEIPLAEALDAPKEVAWATSAELPFRGGPDAYAKNGNAAQIGLMPGEETWLEATVSGPGQFDFWLRNVPGALNDPRALEWELFIDGVRSHINTRNATWPAQWLLGAGVHEIRLVFRNSPEADAQAYIAVDDVSWIPLVPGSGEEGWTASHPELVDGFANGGFDDGPQHVLPVATGEVRWVEKTVTGPGLLSWQARLTRGGYPSFQRQVLLNGVATLPLGRLSEWTTNRLHLPVGVHTVRWICEPGENSQDPYPEQTDSIWQISQMAFLSGVPPLMQGIDHEEAFWLAVGNAEGSLISGEAAYDGADAWSLGDETTLYLCNPSPHQGIKAQGMVFRRDDDGSAPAWAPLSRWIGPGESVEWVGARSYGYVSYEPPCFVDDIAMRKIDVVPFDQAVDTDQEITANGWIGLAEANEAFDGEDTAWSLLTRSYASNIAWLSLQGPAKMRFRWKATGSGKLGLLVDQAWLPVAAPGADWQEVEFEVYEAAVIKWVHQATSETSTDASAEAWLDLVSIQSLPTRTLDLVTGEGSGLAFENTADATDADRWRPAAYRDESGTWQEGARGITGAAGLQTTVTGPKLLSFRSYASGVNIPTPDPAVADEPVTQSVVGVLPDFGFITTGRYLSVAVGDREKLRIIPEDGEGWTDHLVHVPAGEHQVTWRLGRYANFGSASVDMPEWQAWVGEVSLQQPRAHYEAWAAEFLADSDASGPGDDADGNGTINFMEYAYGSDPKNGGSKPPEMFGLVQPNIDYYGDLGVRDFVLHVPRLPAHVSAVLQTSSDLVTWTPSPIPLRSFPSMETDWLIGAPRDTDSGIYQVIRFEIPEGQPTNYFRIKLDLPGP